MDEHLLKIFDNIEYERRNKTRIKKFLKRFQQSWELSPDLRFGQMLMILVHDKDCWNWEIDKWYDLLNNFDNHKTIMTKFKNPESNTSSPSIGSDSTSIT